MNHLHSDVLSYLETLGFNILEKKDDYIVGNKAGLGGTQDVWQVWILDQEERDISTIERFWTREIEQRSQEFQNASRWIVGDSLGGITRKFREDAEKKFGVKFRARIQFFDTEYKADKLTGSTTTEITSLKVPVARIPQPFAILDETGEKKYTGDDILEHLSKEFQFGNKSSLRIVVGPAGVGKTWFFRNLFASLYSHFLDQKARLGSFPRPVPLTPQYLRGRGASLRTQDLLRDFIESEIATYVPQSTFEWMLASGYTTWLFDGLDELYHRDQPFFEIIADLLTRPPASRAQILICSRDSLLSSSEGFTDFLKDFPPGRSSEPLIELYQLENWEHPSKSAFANLHLDHKDEQTRFLKYISRSDSLRTLSSLPFYCNMLMDEFKRGDDEEFSDDFSLIEKTVSSIIEREEKKGILVQSNLIPNGLNDWLEEIAERCYATDFKGISKADAETYAMLVLNKGLSDEERQNSVTTLIQFPLLSRGLEIGVLTFEHELVAEYLAGRYWLRRIISDPARVAHEFSVRADFSDSLVGRFIAYQLPKRPGGLEAILTSLRDDVLLGRDFNVLLQLLLMANPTRDVLKKHNVNLESRDLSQVLFLDRDLTGFSFRNSLLSNAEFRNCNLQSSKFEGAYISGTRFAQLLEESLEEARFGNIERFEFAYVGQRLIEDRSKFIEWIQKVTGETKPIQDPCPTAQQFRALFLKFVHPDGSGRRSEMGEDILSRGKRYDNAPSPAECLEASIGAGYIQRLVWHDRVRRVPGDRYDDIVYFVRDWKMPSRIKEMFDETCPIKNCTHVPKNYIFLT